MSKKNKFEKFNLQKNSIQEKLQGVSLVIGSLQKQGEPEAGTLIVTTLPKTILKTRPEDNLDYMIGAIGNPNLIAEVIAKKASKDLDFAEYALQLSDQLNKKLMDEGIEEKIRKSKDQADQFVKAKLKEMNQKK